MKSKSGIPALTEIKILLSANLNFDGLDCVYQIWNDAPYQADTLILDYDDLEFLTDEEIEFWFRSLNLITDVMNNSEVVIKRKQSIEKVFISFNFILVN